MNLYRAAGCDTFTGTTVYGRPYVEEGEAYRDAAFYKAKHPKHRVFIQYSPAYVAGQKVPDGELPWLNY